jgi:TetR/AcrR family transcriptional repressor of nem operon
MRYSSDHKKTTHDTVVATASRAFRHKGISGVGIATLMRDAGLTHGGFYAHFQDKDALVDEALGFALDESLGFLQAASSKGGLEAMVTLYLSEGHRDQPAKGCPLPSLSAEVGRGTKASRGAFARKLDVLFRLVADAIPSDRPERRRERAAFAFSAMAGAVSLARATAGTPMSRTILESTKSCLLQALTIER